MFSHYFNWHRMQLFVLTFVAYIVANAVFYCYLAKDFFAEKLGNLMQMPSHEMGGMASWFDHQHMLMYLVAALIAKGVIIFVLPRTKGNMVRALILGGVFGLIVCGTHQILNLSMIAGWPVEVVYVSVAWHAILLSALSALAVYVAELCGCEHIACGCDLKGKNKCQ